MKRETGKHHIDTMLAMLLFGVFAVCILLVLFTGTKVCRKVSLQNRNNFYNRTCAQYLITRVHRSSGVNVEEFGDGSAIMLSEVIEGSEYVTYVYCYDGYMMELFTDPDYEAYPENGEYIIQANRIEAHIDNGMLKAVVYAEDMEPVEIVLDISKKEVSL